jgi:hypothetical protein
MKILFVALILSSCTQTSPVVNSPFSHLDTVQTKVEPKESHEDSEDGSSVKSPFSKIK